eukprot:m51a1_g7876 hypothetical protein (205) ;mRNA; f:28141-29198
MASAAAASPTKHDDSDEALVRARLMYKEAPLKRVARRFLSFRSAVESSKPLPECEELYAAFERELESYEFSLREAEVLCATYEAEQALFLSLARERDAAAAAAAEQLRALQSQLAEERAASHHKEELAALRGVVQASKSTVPQLETAIAQLEREVAELQRVEKEEAQRLEERTKQMQLLLHAASLLNSELEAEKDDDVVMHPSQ